MKATTLVSIITVFGVSLFASNNVPQVDQTELPKRDLTLMANPETLQLSPAEAIKIKTRVLKADHAAAVARIAAIEARIRQIQVESEGRIKALSAERDALLRREKEISEALSSSRP